MADKGKGHSDKLRSKNKRDGTPEKPNTPSLSQDALQEESPQPEKKPVIVNEEILGMAITHDKLQKLREPHPPMERKKSPKTSSIIVRKMKPSSEWNKPKTIPVTVTKPAPQDAPLKKINYCCKSGPRYDDLGRIVPHSILGSVDDYMTVALKKGDMPQELADLQVKDVTPPVLPVHTEPPKQKKQHPNMASVDESNALENWQAAMRERRKQQGYLSRLLQKPVESLAMNQAEEYRKTQETRYLIDRTLPSMTDKGKGYRVGSEFWAQRKPLGSELTGLHTTLTTTEQGYPPPIEHIGIPKTVLNEKGLIHTRPSSASHKPWHRSQYLQQRLDQLRPVINELDPYNTNFEHLEVVGRPGENVTAREGHTMTYDEDFLEREEENLDPLSHIPDVHPAPIFGPAITFAGNPVSWTGDSTHCKGQVGVEARILFEALTGKKAMSHLEVANVGTTVIYYDWKKLEKSNPFDVIRPPVHRFYFNSSDGYILPGETLKIPFIFKSRQAGIFTEQWEFQTHPVVGGGATLMVILRGSSMKEDKYLHERNKIEAELAHRQAVQITTKILDDLLESINAPERPRSPIDSYLTESESFTRANPGLQYHHETIKDLHTMFLALHEEEERENVQWSLSIDQLKHMILMLEEEDDRKQEFQQKLNAAVLKMSVPGTSPATKKMIMAGQEVMAEFIDKMVDRIVTIRTMLGMPDKDEEGLEDASTISSVSIGDNIDHVKSHEELDSVSLSEGDGKKGARRSDKDKKKDQKQPPKTPGGRDSKAGKITPASRKTSVAQQPSMSGRATPPTSNPQSPAPTGIDPVLEKKYKDKVYLECLTLLEDTVDQMSGSFEQIQNEDGGKKLPKL